MKTFQKVAVLVIFGWSVFAGSGPAENGKPGLKYLAQTASNLLAGCRVPAKNGTPLYTPDGKGNYRALWTRDFAYMVENAGDLIPERDVEAALRFLLDGIRADGAAPDRVRPDGVAVYSAGPEGHPVGAPNIDNAQFLVIAMDEHLKRLSLRRSLALFREWADELEPAMDYIPRSLRGLVENDPENPHSPYGFTDTVGKTGELFFESLLYWTACQRLAGWHQRAGHEEKADRYRGRARRIESNVDILWDETAGAFLAATKDCRQLDVWGNAYAVYLDFPLGAKRSLMLRFLETNYDRYVWHGQVRHLLKGEHWQRLLTPVQPERYQNGAYWATASGWVIWALAQTNPGLARQMWSDLLDDFQKNGVYECINEGYRQLDRYVVSATNPLAVGRLLNFTE